MSQLTRDAFPADLRIEVLDWNGKVFGKRGLDRGFQRQFQERGTRGPFLCKGNHGSQKTEKKTRETKHEGQLGGRGGWVRLTVGKRPSHKPGGKTNLKSKARFPGRG